MADVTGIGAAVVGTGFIGSVHAGAIRRLGAELRGIVGSSAERGQEKRAAMGARHAYASMDEMLEDDGVQVVHVTSPNHLHYDQVKAVLAAGKNVVCEKPLAMTSDQSAEMVRLAKDSGLVAAVCYNIRFYPLNQHARGMVASGELGTTRLVTGHYVQDWLSTAADWNWRLEPEAGGALRAVGDIGTHWMDLTSFVTGERPAEVLAELATFLPEREKPSGPVESFTASAGETETVKVGTEDAALILLRYPSGARGQVTISQVSPGRKNSLHWDVAGSEMSAAWDSETPDHLFLGRRDAPNGILQRDAALMNEAGAAAAVVPGGHVEGFADTFHALFRQVYGAVAEGRMPETPAWATFDDGHFEMLFCEAVLESARTGGWARIGE